MWYLETDTYRSTWGRPEDLDFGLRRRERIYDAQRKRERDELLVGPPEATWHKGFYLSRKKEDEEEDKGIVITESGLVLEISDDDDISEFSSDEDLDDETTVKRRTAKMAAKAKGTGGEGPSEPTDIPEDQMGTDGDTMQALEQDMRIPTEDIPPTIDLEGIRAPPTPPMRH